jgi:DNA-binding protein Fis
MLTASNTNTDYSVRFKDPDTGEEVTLPSADSIPAYQARKQQEKREAPAPAGTPPSAEAPSQRGNDEEIVDSFDRSRQPAQAPGASNPADAVEAPGSDRDPSPIEAAPLTAEQRASINRDLWSGARLTPTEKNELRQEARWRFEQATGKPIPAGQQVHHVIPLEFAHLFRGDDPNDLKNLVLMTEVEHQRLHILLNQFIREKRGGNQKITRADLETMRETFLKTWKHHYTPIK